MFTPEFVSEERGEYVLVANHRLDSAECVRLSIAYNRARVAHGATHLPPHIQKCRIIYDIRGQSVSTQTQNQLRQGLQTHCTVEFKN
jgi:hypothetical protein